MKTNKRIFTLSLATAVLTGATSLLAQDQTSTPPPPSPAGNHGPGGWQKRENPLANLTKDQREELKTVTEKIKDDSKVVAARNDLKEAEKAQREAMKAAIEKADPNAKPPEAGKRQDLTQDQREALRAAFQKAKEDSTVQAADAQAKTARANYVSVWRAAALAADSNIQAVLDKLPKDFAPGEMGGMRGGDRRGGPGHHAKPDASPSPTTSGSSSN